MKYIKTFEQLGANHVNSNDAGDNFWGNAGAGILPICLKTGRILVAYRSLDVNEPHTFGIFGGAIDAYGDDHTRTPEQSAREELSEEAGYNDHFDVIPAYVFKTPNGSFTYYNFIGLLEHEFEPELNWETESAKWITLQELYDLKPKHFGLEALIKNSGDIIRKYAK
jgi:8-oxo-dGTP pyrophosphatase MutT (NUDIX family)